MEPRAGSLVSPEMAECAPFTDEETEAQSGAVTQPSPLPGSGGARMELVGLPALLPPLLPLWNVCCGPWGDKCPPYLLPITSALLTTEAVTT